MSSWLNILLVDLIPELVTRLVEGKIGPTFEATLFDAEDEFLAKFRLNLDGSFTVMNEDNPKIEKPVFPVTVTAKDASGNHFEMTWMPPSIQ